MELDHCEFINTWQSCVIKGVVDQRQATKARVRDVTSLRRKFIDKITAMLFESCHTYLQISCRTSTGREAMVNFAENNLASTLVVGRLEAVRKMALIRREKVEIIS